MPNILPGHEVSLPLAVYKNRDGYSPSHGDFVIWTGWITTWVGIVSGYNYETGVVSIIFSSIPFLLFNMEDAEQRSQTRDIPLSRIINSLNGTWAILQHDKKNNSSIWYV